MTKQAFDMEFYRGKRVLITGHTGFKGSWLCKILARSSALVTGFALAPPDPSLYTIADIGRDVDSHIGDIRDYAALKRVFDRARPEIVFHLAAQPIVLEGYRNPAYTYETNVMGTVNILECVRNGDCTRSFLNVTTDKVYQNNEWVWGYRETEVLYGRDPYSNSKSCSELVTGCYRECFFPGGQAAVSTARAGNVIGGGDFARDRILPDCVRAALNNEEIAIRNPGSVRPYQHVLEPLCAYLMIAGKQYEDGSCAGCYNIGPEEEDCIQTEDLVDRFLAKWGAGGKRIDRCAAVPHEAGYLKLDCSILKAALAWEPRWNIDEAIARTVEWTKCWLAGEDVRDCMDRQIEAFLRG